MAKQPSSARVHPAGDGGRVVVAMSGGVDSSVAALLLARAGYEVVGVTMRLFSQPSDAPGARGRSCCAIEDVDDARAVCRAIGARHYFLNFERQFEQHVVDYFVREYERGRTPHPCLACNDRLKFDFLLERAGFLGARYIATGHYARVEERGGRMRLFRGVDPSKDQSYALYTLGQGQMRRLLLPVGWQTKHEIRRVAAEARLPVAGKPDSQDICFVPAGDYRAFIEPRLARRAPGDIVDGEGNVLGHHDGIHAFTVGQRKRLPLPGGSGGPLFVTAIDADTGAVTVGPATDLLRRRALVTGVSWTAGEPPASSRRVTACVRYRGTEAEATVRPEGDAVVVDFHEPQRAITPGQAAVFYDGDELIGGGVIERALPGDAPGPPRTATLAAATG